MKNNLLLVFLFLFFACSPNLKVNSQKKYYIDGHKNFNEQLSGNFTIGKRWWNKFNDPNLSYIVEEILKNSLDIKNMEINLQITKKRYEEELSTRYPELNLQAEATRKGQHTEDMFGKKVYTLGNSYSLSLFASYELDLFKKLKARQKSYFHTFLETQYEKKAAVQSVLVEGIRLYFYLSYLQHKKSLIEQIKNIARQKYEIAKISYNKGIIDLNTLKTYHNLFKSRQNDLTSINREIKDKFYELSVLVGRYPTTGFKITRWAKISEDILKINPGIPSDLLKRRPDIRAMEEKLKSLEAKAKVARRARFPNITLTGSAGFASLELKELLLSESSFFSIGGNILQPIFNAGKLKREEEIAILNFRMAEVEFSKTVLNALREVEGVLNVERTLREQKRVIGEIKKNREKQLAIQKIKYFCGDISLIELKDMEEKYIDILLTKEQNRFDLLSNRLNLVKALGGDW